MSIVLRKFPSHSTSALGLDQLNTNLQDNSKKHLNTHPHEYIEKDYTLAFLGI